MLAWCSVKSPEETTIQQTQSTVSNTENVTQLTTMIQEENTAVSLPQKGRSIANQDMTQHDLIALLERETLIGQMVVGTTDSVVTPSPVTTDFSSPVGTNGILGVYTFPQSIIENNPVVKQKLQHFKYLRADVEVRVIVNNSPFMAGCLGLHYAPYLFELESAYQQNVSSMGLTSLPTTMLHTEIANTMTMTMPFINERDYYDLTTTQHSFGTTILTNWGLAPAGDETIKVQVFARFVNVRVSVPTNKVISVVAEGENEQEGPITQASGMIGKLGALAGASGIPILSTIGTVTSWVSRAVGAVAGHFGWSKPLNVSHPTHVERTPAKGYTHTIGTDGSVCLGTIPDNAINSQDVNPSNDDEMVISYINSRPNIFQKLTWNKNQLFGKMIGYIFHQPIKNTGFYYGTFDYLASMFQYWRGTIDYHFKFIKTKYHMGRLIFVYYPSGNPSAELTTEMTTNYTCIVDLNEINADDIGSGEFILSIPYMASVPWTQTDDTVGVIGIYVSTPLAAPTTCADELTIWVGHSGGDSYELSVPTCAMSIVAEGGDDRANMMGSTTDTPGMQATIQCIGERVDSLRPLVKRFTPNSLNGRTPAIKVGAAEFFPHAVPNNDNSMLRQIQRLFRFHAGGHRFKAVSNTGALVQANLLDSQARLTGVSHTTMSSINNFNEVLLPHYSVNRCWATGRDPNAVPEFTTLGMRYDSYSYTGVIETEVSKVAAFPAFGVTSPWAGGDHASFLVTKINSSLDYLWLGKNPSTPTIKQYVVKTSGGDSGQVPFDGLPNANEFINIRLAEENTIPETVESIQLMWVDGPNAGKVFKTFYSTLTDHTTIRKQIATIAKADILDNQLVLDVTWTAPKEQQISLQFTSITCPGYPIQAFPGTVIPIETGDTITSLWGGNPLARYDEAKATTRYSGLAGSVTRTVNPFSTLIAGHDDFNSFFLCNPPLTRNTNSIQ